MSDPAAANKLLAMLRAGGGSKPATQGAVPYLGNTNGSAAPAGLGGPSHQPVNGMNGTSGTNGITHHEPQPHPHPYASASASPSAAPLRPSALSPVPTGRAVSLNDLFANMGQPQMMSQSPIQGQVGGVVSPPPPGGAGGVASPSAVGAGESGHRYSHGASHGMNGTSHNHMGGNNNNTAGHLLGMLRGESTTSPPPGIAPSPLGTPLQARQGAQYVPFQIPPSSSASPHLQRSEQHPSSAGRNGDAASPPAVSAARAPQVPSGPVDLLGLLKKVQSRSVSGANVSAAPAVHVPSAATPPPVPAKPAASDVATTDTAAGKEQAWKEEGQDQPSGEPAVHLQQPAVDSGRLHGFEDQVEEGLGEGKSGNEAAEPTATADDSAEADDKAYAPGSAEGEGGSDDEQKEADSALTPNAPPSEPATASSSQQNAPATPVMASPVPNKTPFDFVSPFDMFVKPKASTPAPVAPAAPAPAVASATVSPVKKGAKAPTVVKGEKEAGSALPTAPTPRKASAAATSNSSTQQSAVPTVAKPGAQGNVAGSPMKAVQAVPTLPSELSASIAASTQSDGAMPSKQNKAVLDLDRTWQVGRVVAGQSGTGPTIPPAHITIDLSQPNLSSLINDKQAVQVIPTTVMKASDTTFRHGRVQGITEGWMAYGLSKGKIRLIDRATGSRLVITLGGSASSGQIIDLAVTPTLLAVVGADHSISAYRVPRSWSSDDPACDRILQMHGSSDETGSPFKVEWVRKGAEYLLAIGGSNGVVLVDPAHVGKRLDDVVRKHKVLFTEGDMVDFCLNQTHQAIGLMSSTSIFSLYSLASLSRVWHRPFPSSSPAGSAPSSVMFCESNLLVGRDRNTRFDLVQITTDLAVLGSITLLAPPPCPAEYHYAHAVYDAAHQNIWIAPFARGSLIGLKYTLKGQAPVRVSQGESKAPWNVLGEVYSSGLEPIVSLVAAESREGQDLDLFYGHVKGFSMATIQADVLSHSEEGSSLEVSAPSQPRAVEVAQESQEEAPSQPQAASVVPSTASAVGSAIKETVPPPAGPITPMQQGLPIPEAELSSAPSATSAPMSRRASKASANAKSPAAQAAIALPQAVNQSSPQKQAAGPNSIPSGLSEKNLKKMEDRIITQTRQAVSSSSDRLAAKYDAVSVERLASEITAQVDKAVSGTIAQAIREEIKKTASAAIQQEIRQAVPAAIVTSARQILPAELEREMGSLLHHILPGAVQAAVDRSVQSAVQRIIMPDMEKIMGKMTDAVLKQVRQEILQIKKDMSTPPEAAPAVDLTAITETLLDMQKQIASLSEQLARQHAAPPPQPPAPSTRPPPADALPSVPPPLPAQTRPMEIPPPAAPMAMQVPSSKDLEDAFLTALSQSSTASTVQLVSDYYHLTEYCLPIPGRPPHSLHGSHASPLSAAVKITLLHRLSLALADLPLNDPAFTKCLDWEERVAILVDPAEQETSAFYPRVKEMVLAQMGTLLQKMETEGLGGSGVAYAVRGVMDGLARKG